MNEKECINKQIEDKIDEISNLSSNPKNLKLVLSKLKDCYNFNYFLDKVKREFKKRNQDIYSEIFCAYRLKKLGGLNIGFMPEKPNKGEVVPAPKVKKDDGLIKTPDIWIINKGSWRYVEVKRLRLNKMDFLRCLYSSRYPEILRQKITGRIIGKVTSSIEKIENFGSGFVYIECERGQVDLDKIEKRLQDIFRNNPNISGLILVYNLVTINDLSLNPKIKIFYNNQYKARKK